MKDKHVRGQHRMLYRKDASAVQAAHSSVQPACFLVTVPDPVVSKLFLKGDYSLVTVEQTRSLATFTFLHASPPPTPFYTHPGSSI